MIKTAICDDEANIRAYLSSLITAQPYPCEIVEYASAGDCLADHRQADLLFLDIELAPSDLDGMALARKIRERASGTQPVIVFVTGYERYVFDAFDVGIILQNLLQNVLEACGKVGEGERFIVLTGTKKGRFFLIEVKNSFMGEVVFGQDGLPVTTKKEDVPMHGLGLSNVRREAEKYMGELELKTTQREFSTNDTYRRQHTVFS